MLRIEVKPEILRWCRERAGVDFGTLVERFPKYAEWESGQFRPTLKQLERLATEVHAPIGYFFLKEPIEEPIPIPDFRTTGGKTSERPSLELLDVIDVCRRRQDWYREFALSEGEDPVPYIGTSKTTSDVETVAANIRAALNFDLDDRRDFRSWRTALRHLIESADALGVLVTVSGIVGSNTRRKLDPEEFRGFALVDDHAPLVFINGADTRAAQMFTLAHELAHLWLGKSAISDSRPDSQHENAVEQWCNCVAAEILAPLEILRLEYDRVRSNTNAVTVLSHRFRVSTLVILRRILDAGGLTQRQFQDAYETEWARLKTNLKRKGENSGLLRTERTGRRFAQAIVTSTLEGKTSFTESFQLLGLRKTSSFDSLAQILGISN